MYGLSPRVRGNPGGIVRHAVGHGSIPACAGEPAARPRRPRRTKVYPRVCGGTCGRPRRPRRTKVYPRVCGGTQALLIFVVPATGLSPRVRGNRIPAAAVVDVIRSIPACAGEPAHVLLVRRSLLGSIPACAGEPPSVRGGIVDVWVYPRVCGGTAQCARRHRRRMGLSPRVRGNLAFFRGRQCCHGSIPACAGEPPPWPPRWRGWRVYPRVCGGTIRAPRAARHHTGLSPRVRGNPWAARV